MNEIAIKVRPKNVPDPANSASMQRILAALLKQGDLTAQEKAEKAFVSEKTLVCGGYLRALLDASPRLIHISGWRKKCNGFTQVIYRHGKGEDCERPLFTENDRDSLGLAKIESALKRLGPLSAREAAVATGLSENTIKNAGYMEVLVVQQRAHLLDWRRNGRGAMTPIYDHGPGKNARKPVPFSAAEKSRRYREKQRILSGMISVTKLLAA
jgi:hypothetical protein